MIEMSNCTKMQERLSEYIEGTLSVDERLTVEAHLPACVSCTELLESIAGVLRWAHSFPSHPASEQMVSRILAVTSGPEEQNLTCPTVRDGLTEYLDGLLPRNRVAAMDEHLAACGACEELRATMAGAIEWSRTALSYSPPERMVERILANTLEGRTDAHIRCATVEERLSDLVDGQLPPDEELAVNTHVADCGSCHEMYLNMIAVVRWGREFPVFEAPVWFATRIVANTRPESSLPQTVQEKRETFLDTLGALGRWILEPRTAMTVFTAVLMLGWMTRIAGVGFDPAALSNPGAVYSSVEELADDVYDRSVRLYYDVPHALFGQIQYRIEQLGEDSQ